VSEKSITHTKFVVENPEWKSQSGRSRRGWRAKEGQYEDLDLRITNFCCVKSEICVFPFVTSSPTAQSSKLFVFIYLQN